MQMELTTPKTVKQQISKHYPANSTEEPKKEKGKEQKESALAQYRIDPHKAALLDDANMDSLDAAETPVIQVSVGDQTPHSDNDLYLLLAYA